LHSLTRDEVILLCITGKTFSAVDPRLGEVAAEVAEAGREDVDKAVRAARKAFEEGPWPRMPGCVCTSFTLLFWYFDIFGFLDS
jgi:hypothetical protein